MSRAVAINATYFMLRVVAGLLFFQAGAMKMLGWFGGMPAGTQMSTQVWIGGLMECVGGAAIVAGLFTRPIAFLLSGEMAVAYWQFHAPKGTWPIENQGEMAVLFCFYFLYVAARGGGDWSVDNWLRIRLKGAKSS